MVAVLQLDGGGQGEGALAQGFWDEFKGVGFCESWNQAKDT